MSLFFILYVLLSLGVGVSVFDFDTNLSLNAINVTPYFLFF